MHFALLRCLLTAAELAENKILLREYLVQSRTKDRECAHLLACSVLRACTRY